jgi:threonine dehydrogenase-like Zn-dependent dehydrogenase
MPLSRGQEMTEQANTRICENGEKRYATREEFLKIFDRDMNGHEVAGIVAAMGPDVAQLRVGDHVVGSLAQSCGGCAHPREPACRRTQGASVRSSCAARLRSCNRRRFRLEHRKR